LLWKVREGRVRHSEAHVVADLAALGWVVTERQPGDYGVTLILAGPVADADLTT
jgi:hypothetical protein